jgi:Putative MetA-pathway of phenol degradation
MTLKILRDKLILALLIFISFTNQLLAQDQLNELTVDRPGIAESPFTVAPGMYQFETGFEFYNRDSGNIYYLPIILFRTGLSKTAELRIAARELVDRTGAEPLIGIAPLSVGVKVHIIEQDGWIPETDILTNLIVPIGPSKLNPDRLGHEILLLFQHDLTAKTAFNYNIGYLWDGFRQREIFTASVCFNYLRTARSGLFLEYFTFSTERPGEHGIDGGVTYLLRPRLQLDFSVGISRIEKETNYFISSGFSFRLERKKRKP